MNEEYPIYSLDRINIVENTEEDGVLRKDWYNHPELGKCLFKESRPTESIISESRTDWTEKVVCEIANLLNLPVAQYQLVTGKFSDSSDIVEGVVSIDCILTNANEIFTGQQLLGQCINYDIDNPSQYTIDNVLKSLDLAKVTIPQNWQKPISGIDTGAELFVGYILLDTLVNNSDRHDRNWGVVSVEGQIELIPSFDHGLALGSTNTHTDRLTISLSDHVNLYSPSCFQLGYTKIPNLEIFNRTAQLYPKAAKIWQQQLSNINITQIVDILNRVPTHRITTIAHKFAIELLSYNRHRILDLEIKPIEQSIPNNLLKKTSRKNIRER